jgi:hypothetical protein
VCKKNIIWIKHFCKKCPYGIGYTKQKIIIIINNENCKNEARKKELK